MKRKNFTSKKLTALAAVIIFLYLPFNAFSQTNTNPAVPTTIWAKVAGGPSGSIESQNVGISADQNGNIYVTGGFSGTLSFPTLPNATQLTSEGQDDIFIAKYDALVM